MTQSERGSREDMKRLEEIRKQLQESHDIEELRAEALAAIAAKIKHLRKEINGARL